MVFSTIQQIKPQRLKFEGKIFILNIFNPLTTMHKTDPHPPHYHFPIEVAREDTRRWRAAHKINAFVVDKAELLDVIAEDQMKEMRIYFGIDDKGFEKMFLVGAKNVVTISEEGFEKVIVRDLIDYNTDEDAEVVIQHFVYDFSRPCPPLCDDLSPLMT